MGKIRKKLTGKPVIRNWEEAEGVMKMIAKLHREKSAFENAAKEKIEEIKADLLRTTKEISTEMARNEKELEDFCLYHKAEFTGDGKMRRKDLNWGLVGFRQSTGKLKTIAGWKWDMVLAKLREVRRKKWLETKTSIKKTQILSEWRNGDATDDELSVYGMRVDKPDEFWYEIKEDAVESAAVHDIKAA